MVTGGGILAVVQRVKEGSNEIEVEIAPNVRVTVLRDTISTRDQPGRGGQRRQAGENADPRLFQAGRPKKGHDPSPPEPSPATGEGRRPEAYSWLSANS